MALTRQPHTGQAVSRVEQPIGAADMLSEPKRLPDPGSLDSSGGREGIRTPDLTDANRVLSQLSYTPIQPPIQYYSAVYCVSRWTDSPDT